MPRPPCAAALMAAFAFAPASFAQNAVTAAFQVSVEVPHHCNITSLDLNFSADALTDGSNTVAASNVAVSCTTGTPYSLIFSAGQSGDINKRVLTDQRTGHRLHYQICDALDPVCSTPLGDGSTGSSTLLSGVGQGLQPIVHPIRSIIYAGQTVGADSYTDSVAVTLRY